MASGSEPGNERPVVRLACYGLTMGLLSALASCDKKPRSVEHVEVSGNVHFQGEPLPGGQVKFVAVNGGFTRTGLIDENGHYQIEATDRLVSFVDLAPPLLSLAAARPPEYLQGKAFLGAHEAAKGSAAVPGRMRDNVSKLVENLVESLKQ